MTIFEHYKNLVSKNKEIDNVKNISVFYLAYLLSHDKISVLVLDRILKYIYYLPENMIYQYLYQMIPKHKSKYLDLKKKSVNKYIKYAKIMYPEMSEKKLEDNMIFLKDAIDEVLNS